MVVNLRHAQNANHPLKNPILWRVGLWSFISILSVEAIVLWPLIADFMTQMVAVALLATLSTLFILGPMLMLRQQHPCRFSDRPPIQQPPRCEQTQRQYLTIQIDPSKRAEDVAKIIEAESFQRVKHKLQHLRQA